MTIMLKLILNSCLKGVRDRTYESARTLVAVAIALLITFVQPVLSAGHVAHMPSETTKVHSHDHSADVQTHFHQHHQLIHIDLTLSPTSDSLISSPELTPVIPTDFVSSIYQRSVLPETPPPIY